MRSFFLIIFLSSLCFNALAENYYWSTSSSGPKSPSALAAAQSVVDQRKLSNPTHTNYRIGQTRWQSSTNFQFCILYSTSPTSHQNNCWNTVYRYGSTCPSGTEYDTTTGSCVCPVGKVLSNGICVDDNPCLEKNGQSQSFTKSGSSGDGYGTISGGFVASVQSACFAGCSVSTTDQKCTGRVSGLYTCRGTAYYTGQTCAASGISTEIQENTSQQPLPTPQTINDEKPCVYSQDGTKQVCQSSKSNEKEGQFCGTVNGVKTCIDSKPTKNGITIDTTVETENKPDGSKVVKKTDVATKTECKGANDCKSTTTTTTTTTNVNSSGDTTGVTGSCTGDACPDKNTNPDGDGDGFGDCTGDDCGESSGGSFDTPELEETPTIGETTIDFMSRIASAPIIQTIDSIGLSGSGSCSMTSANTSIGTISAASFCDNSHWLDPLYFIFLAIHAFAAVRVFLSA